MKLRRYLTLSTLILSLSTVSHAEESRGFFSWLSDTTSSVWEGTKRTVRSLFGTTEEKVVEKTEVVKTETTTVPTEPVPVTKAPVTPVKKG